MFYLIKVSRKRTTVTIITATIIDSITSVYNRKICRYDNTPPTYTWYRCKVLIVYPCYIFTVPSRTQAARAPLFAGLSCSSACPTPSAG